MDLIKQQKIANQPLGIPNWESSLELPEHFTVKCWIFELQIKSHNSRGGGAGCAFVHPMFGPRKKEKLDFAHPIFWPYFMYCAPIASTASVTCMSQIELLFKAPHPAE